MKTKKQILADGVAAYKKIKAMVDLQNRKDKNENIINALEGITASLSQYPIRFSQNEFDQFCDVTIRANKKLLDAGFPPLEALIMLSPLLQTLRIVHKKNDYREPINRNARGFIRLALALHYIKRGIPKQA